MKLSKESNSNSQTTIFILFSTPLNETEERRHDLVAIYVYSFTFNSPLFLRIFSPFFSHHKTRENWMIIGIPSTRKGRNKTRLVVSPFTLFSLLFVSSPPGEYLNESESSIRLRHFFLQSWTRIFLRSFVRGD